MNAGRGVYAPDVPVVDRRYNLSAKKKGGLVAPFTRGTGSCMLETVVQYEHMYKIRTFRREVSL